jgi:hypothetical protein
VETVSEDKLITASDKVGRASVDRKESEHPSLTTLLANERRLQSSFGAVAAEPVEADCHTDFKANKKSGTRALSAIQKVVIHDTEGGTARSVAMFFSGPNATGSAHLVVDDNTCYRCLLDKEIPWGAPGANFDGFHIEQCGFASWTTTLWSKTHRKTMMRAAFKTALHCKRYGIKVRFLTAANLESGMINGITTHAECSAAFGGTHTDPGKGWSRFLFMNMVRGYYGVITVKKIA